MSSRPITTQQARPLHPTTHTVAEVVRQVTGIKNVPIYETFATLGVSSTQLQQIQIKLLRTFKRTVPTLQWQDTVATVNDQLNRITS